MLLGHLYVYCFIIDHVSSVVHVYDACKARNLIFSYESDNLNLVIL